MGFGNCLFLDTKNQFITKKEVDDSIHLYLPHDSWYIQIPKKELNQFIAANTEAKIISPLTFLYFVYLKHAKENALYILILDDYIYITTFNKGEPLFTKIYAVEESDDLADDIEDFLHSFYDQPNAFFIEHITIYNLNDGFIILPEEIKERLLLDLEIHTDGLEKYCNNSELSRYFLNIPQEVKSLRLNNRFIFMVAGGILLILVAFDLYLKFSNQEVKKNIQSLVQKQQQLGNTNNQIQTKLLYLKKIAPLYKEVQEKNSYISSFIKQLFDQIPSHTYLTLAEFSDGELILKGVSQNLQEIQKLHQKLSQSFKKERLSLTKHGSSYIFEAAYKEETNNETN